MAATDNAEGIGPWDGPALATFREWDPVFVEQCLKMSNGSWTNGILPSKDVELISLAVHAAITNLSPGGTRRHIRGALAAGATREQILMVLKIASLLSIHTASLGAPILLEEAKAAGVKPAPRAPAATPVCDGMKAAGQWNMAWDGFFELDPAWTEAIIAASLPVYTSGVFTPKLAELLSIAVDASITHMYAPGTRRHIQSALKLGATVGRSWKCSRSASPRVYKRAISVSQSWPRSFNAGHHDPGQPGPGGLVAERQARGRAEALSGLADANHEGRAVTRRYSVQRGGAALPNPFAVQVCVIVVAGWDAS